MGLLAAVAVYFWTPLLRGWIQTDEPGTVPGASGPDGGVGQPPFAGVAAAAERPAVRQEKSTYRWPQLDEWMNGDPATRSADLSALRDPFQPVRAAVSAEELAASATAAGSHVDPEQLGVKLTGTLFGSGRRVALIDGRAYREGELVELGPKDQPVEFELIRVNRGGIVLGFNDRQFDVAIPERERPGRLKLTSNTN